MLGGTPVHSKRFFVKVNLNILVVVPCILYCFYFYLKSIKLKFPLNPILLKLFQETKEKNILLLYSDSSENAENIHFNKMWDNTKIILFSI